MNEKTEKTKHIKEYTYNCVMAYKIMAKTKGTGYFFNELFHLGLCSISVVQTKMITRFQINCDCTVWILLQIDLKHFLSYIIVI